MTVKEVAEIEKKNPETIRRWIRNNEIKQHGYKIMSFNSKKNGYQLEMMPKEIDYDKMIEYASERLNYFLKMADTERERIAFLKQMKKAQEEGL